MFDLGAELEDQLKRLCKTSAASLHFVPLRDPILLSYPCEKVVELVKMIVGYSSQRLQSPDDTIEVQLVSFPDYVRIAIADTGEGLLPNSELFDLFPRGESSSMYLSPNVDAALFNAVRLAKKIGARVWVQSKWKMGTVFYIDAPYLGQSGKILPFRSKSKASKSGD